MSQKTIAVVGATGAQGGGLVRAILADPSGGFTARALTRDAGSPKAKELARLGAEVVAADVDDAASLRRAFQGAYGAFCVTFFWNHISPGEGAGRGPDHGPGGEGRRAAARRLVHPRGHAQVGAARGRAHAHSPGQVQGAALRREGRGERDLLRPRRAHHLPQHVLLLGQPDPLRDGPEEGPRRPAGLRPADGGQEAARHRRRGHRPVRLRHLQARSRARREDGGHRRRAPDRGPDGGGARPRARAGSRLQLRAPRGLPHVRVPRGGRPRQHVPVQAGTSRRPCAGRATSPSRGR